MHSSAATNKEAGTISVLTSEDTNTYRLDEFKPAGNETMLNNK